MTRAPRRTVRSRQKVDRLTLIVLIIFLIVACITGAVAFTWARMMFAPWSMTHLPGLPGTSGQSGGLPTPPLNTLPNNAQAPSGSLDPQLIPTPVPWDGTSRVTVLIMGLDYRDWSEGSDIPRTDSMILLSIDPLTQTAGVLSIPRDLWVTIPGMGESKINTAYRWGELYDMPDGPTLAMKTVEGVIGVPIQYYALIDFNAFVKFIDTLGGLDIKIREPITIDPIGPGNTITLEPGTQTLTGAEALAYARERHTGDGDFSRSARQQEVIMALRKQILTLNMMPTLIAKAPALYSELKDGIRTNLTLQQVIQLAVLGSQIKEENIHKGVFNPHEDVTFETISTPDGIQDVLIPNYERIRALRDEVFATSAPAAPATIAKDLAKLTQAENARIRVLNGSGAAGLAAKTGDLLKEQQFNITGADNADRVYETTTIIDYSGKPDTVEYLVQQMGLQNIIRINRFDPNAEVDIDLIIGQDWAAKQPQ